MLASVRAAACTTALAAFGLATGPAAPGSSDLRLASGAPFPAPAALSPGGAAISAAADAASPSPFQVVVRLLLLPALETAAAAKDPETYASLSLVLVDTTPPTMGRVREHSGDGFEDDCMLANKNMTVHVEWEGFEGMFVGQNCNLFFFFEFD